jgi:hypothetical protein
VTEPDADLKGRPASRTVAQRDLGSESAPNPPIEKEESPCHEHDKQTVDHHRSAMSQAAATNRAATGATPPGPPTVTPSTTTADLTDEPHHPGESRAARVRQVEDSDIEAALDAIVETAPPLPYKDRARIAFLLGGHRPNRRTSTG